MILDTNAVSRLADGDPSLREALQGMSSPHLPAIVLGEYRYGIAGSRHADRYAAWLAELVKGSEVLDVDERTATHYAAIRGELRRKGTPMPSNDTWIAALARQHRLPVLSRDEHFDRVGGVRRVGW